MINFYVALLAERQRRLEGVADGAAPSVHFFSTFFYAKLAKDGYQGVRRWTTKAKLGYDIMQCARVVVPVHQARRSIAAIDESPC